MVARDVRHQLPEPALLTVVVVVVVVATQARQVILQWLEAQAVRVVVETAEHLLGMAQHAPRAQVEMVLQTLVAVAAVEDIAKLVTAVAVAVERELLSFVMPFRKYPPLTLILQMTLVR
jgi:uncharacterized membrane protein YjdF